MLNGFGSGFTNEQMASANTEHGGHSNIRAVVDGLQANCLNRALQVYIRRALVWY